MANSVNAAQTAQVQQQNVNPSGCQVNTMSSDFFGSQAFCGGFNNPAAQQTPAYNFEPPTNAASALVQQHYAQNCPSFTGGVSGATAQDYYMATQIAKKFANNQALLSPCDSYFQRDMFAQQLVHPSYRTGVNYMA